MPFRHNTRASHILQHCVSSGPRVIVPRQIGLGYVALGFRNDLVDAGQDGGEFVAVGGEH
jgi:hypothetical protein